MIAIRPLEPRDSAVLRFGFAQRAHAAGIRRFTASVLGDNVPALKLIRSLRAHGWDIKVDLRS